MVVGNVMQITLIKMFVNFLFVGELSVFERSKMV